MQQSRGPVRRAESWPGGSWYYVAIADGEMKVDHTVMMGSGESKRKLPGAFLNDERTWDVGFSFPTYTSILCSKNARAAL